MVGRSVCCFWVVWCWSFLCGCWLCRWGWFLIDCCVGLYRWVLDLFVLVVCGWIVCCRWWVVVLGCWGDLWILYLCWICNVLWWDCFLGVWWVVILCGCWWFVWVCLVGWLCRCCWVVMYWVIWVCVVCWVFWCVGIFFWVIVCFGFCCRWVLLCLCSFILGWIGCFLVCCVWVCCWVWCGFWCCSCVSVGIVMWVLLVCIVWWSFLCLVWVLWWMLVCLWWCIVCWWCIGVWMIEGCDEVLCGIFVVCELVMVVGCDDVV